jgi:hypothetical protein
MSTRILWQGISELDHKTPILILATEVSENGKTGPMAQTWIVRADMPPSEAVKKKLDDAICWTCELKDESICYAHNRLPDGPWHVWSEGRATSPPSIRRWARLRAIRAGSYGDPTAAPFEVWDELLGAAPGHTGYTRQWRNPRFQPFQKYLMASVFNEAEKREANSLGWRTYRIATIHEEPVRGEVMCPHTTQGLTCTECLACNGRQWLKGNVMIRAGGSAWRILRFHKMRAKTDALLKEAA